MKAILLPTDFSKNSMNAIHYAMNLFENESCEFYILNVQTVSSFISDDLMTMSTSASVYQTILGTAKKSIKNLINSIEAQYNNEKHKFHSIVDYDNFVDAVNQVCDSKEIDLIVMGTKGATGAQKVIFGSNAVHIMQRCETPVLAIPDNCNFTNVDRIVFTSNYSTFYDRNDLKPLLDMTNRFNSKIDVLHLIDKEPLTENQENIKDLLELSFSNINCEFIELESGDIFKTTHNYILQNDIKMLCMMSKKHSFFERLLARHLVETFAFKIDIPFLVMKNTSSD